MRDACEYRFVIDAHTPDTLPMSRLAEYMAALARLFGNAEQVHFVRLEPGSAALVQIVEPEAAPMVRRRLHTLAHDDVHQEMTSQNFVFDLQDKDSAVSDKAPDDVTEAFGALNRYLAADHAVGSLRESGGAEVLRFPGRERTPLPTFGAFNQPGVLDGVLVRIGGQADTVRVHLRDGDTTHKCNATRDMAMRLAVHLFGPTLRVRGHGRWKRDADGGWAMKRFNIESFHKLDDAPLSEVVERLRRVEGSGWKDVDDPSAELRRLRGPDEVH